MPKADGPQFDDLILSRARLGIVSTLMAGDEAEFTFLRNALKLSDGNLSVQIRKLEKAGYIKVKKVFVERKPKTFCKITPKGRKAMFGLLKHLENLLRQPK
ncbi:MAG TPA: transcriptional regulator [Planctomycetes bacterium]|nr:transcriptional regulator [Planctomycetota bacterium]